MGRLLALLVITWIFIGILLIVELTRIVRVLVENRNELPLSLKVIAWSVVACGSGVLVYVVYMVSNIFI